MDILKRFKKALLFSIILFLCSTSFAQKITNELKDGDKGDITVSAGGAIWTVDDGAGGASQLNELSDIGVATQVAGRLLVSDGTDFQSVQTSGDITLSAAGELSFVSPVDMSGLIFEPPNGTTLPAGDCDSAGEAGRIFILTNTTSGQQLYSCEGIDGWKLQGDGGGVGGSTAWDDIGDPDADSTVAFTDYKQTMTSTLNSAGAVLTLTNTSVDLTSDVSFIDMKHTDDGDANGYYMRGYDATATSLKWSIGNNGVFTGNSFVAEGAGTSTVVDFNVTGELQIDGAAISLTGLSDVSSATQGAGRMLVSDGTDFGSVLITDVVGRIGFESPADTDDITSFAYAAANWTLTGIGCETEGTGSSLTFDVNIDDGSPAAVNGSSITCNTTWTVDSSLAGDTSYDIGDRLDLNMVGIGATAPTEVMIHVIGQRK